MHIGHLPTWGVHFSMSYLFAISYCSWGSHSKNTEVVYHSLLQWTTFYQNCPPWPDVFGWPYTAWIIVSMTETRLWSMWSDKLVFCDCGFILSSLWWIRIKGLWKFPDGKDWLRGNWVLYSSGFLCVSSHYLISPRVRTLEKGMVNHFSILASRSPWTVWKGKMIGYQKRNSLGW